MPFFWVRFCIGLLYYGVHIHIVPIGKALDINDDGYISKLEMLGASKRYKTRLLTLSLITQHGENYIKNKGIKILKKIVSYPEGPSLHILGFGRNFVTGFKMFQRLLRCLTTIFNFGRTLGTKAS